MIALALRFHHNKTYFCKDYYKEKDVFRFKSGLILTEKKCP